MWYLQIIYAHNRKIISQHLKFLSPRIRSRKSGLDRILYDLIILDFKHMSIKHLNHKIFEKYNMYITAYTKSCNSEAAQDPGLAVLVEIQSSFCIIS